MTRRDFLGPFFAGTILWALAAAAQQGRIASIGILTPFVSEPFFTPFWDEMTARGWQRGRNLQIHSLPADGSNEGLESRVNELIAARVDAIVAAGDPAIRAAQHGTAAVPVVGITDDMVGSGLIASMARPGGHTTGISILASELDVKRLELLHELAPRASRIGILADPTTVSTNAALGRAARALGTELTTRNAANRAEVERALDDLLGADVEAVNVLASPILFGNHPLIIERLNRARVPAIYQWPESVARGGLAGYGPRFAQVNRQLAVVLDRVLHGAKPADLPVEQPTRFELVINLKTAQALGLTLPQTLLARADEVIE